MKEKVEVSLHKQSPCGWGGNYEQELGAWAAWGGALGALEQPGLIPFFLPCCLGTVEEEGLKELISFQQT